MKPLQLVIPDKEDQQFIS